MDVMVMAVVSRSVVAAAASPSCSSDRPAVGLALSPRRCDGASKYTDPVEMRDGKRLP